MNGYRIQQIDGARACRERAEMNVELTYVFDGEDYDLACRKGKRH
ncbi:hypothetical protein IMSAGC022_00795 [Alistipes sp.]|nr:hypothetical protein IMSAGC022_00795 [Alistipes sp.]